MDVKKIRREFPLLEENSKHRQYIYFDNACQSLRPRPVIDAITAYYRDWSACGGRSNHQLSTEVPNRVASARQSLARLINAASEKEIIFTRNTTEGINLVANALALEPGDVVLVSDKEHNSNLIPWQVAAKKRGILLKIIPSAPDETFSLANFESLLDSRVKLVSIGWTSNLDGVSVPASEIVKKAHQKGALVLLDAAQAAPHQKINVRGLDIDFLAFSGHKMLGPSGSGVLYGKLSLLEKLDPFLKALPAFLSITVGQQPLEVIDDRKDILQEPLVSEPDDVALLFACSLPVIVEVRHQTNELVLQFLVLFDELSHPLFRRELDRCGIRILFRGLGLPAHLLPARLGRLGCLLNDLTFFVRFLPHLLDLFPLQKRPLLFPGLAVFLSASFRVLHHLALPPNPLSGVLPEGSGARQLSFHLFELCPHDLGRRRTDVDPHSEAVIAHRALARTGSRRRRSPPRLAFRAGRGRGRGADRDRPPPDRPLDTAPARRIWKALTGACHADRDPLRLDGGHLPRP